MKKVLHYFRCGLNLMFVFWKKIKKKVFETINKYFKIVTCIYLVYVRKHRESEKTNPFDREIEAFCGNNSDSRLFQERIYDLTIIIPVYNVEAYIEECLMSIINQKTKYCFEIIIVDDGSTDKTVTTIIKKFNNEKIKLFQQKNAGQSAARNKAISLSQGKYIMFVDGDDVLLPNAIENMMNEAYEKNADLVEGSVVNFQDNINEEMVKESETKYHVESNQTNPYFVLTCNGYSVAKVYRFELWKTLRFPEGYIFEDVITKFILRRKANKVVFLGESIYGYRQNLNSSTRGNDKFKLLDSIRVFPYIMLLCQQEEIPLDDVFYILALNHIGLLNYITLKNQNESVKSKYFLRMRKQLTMIEPYRACKLPFMFKLLEKSISIGQLDVWQCVADTIIKFGMLKRWREIN
mgnify:CR=1 FL=1